MAKYKDFKNQPTIRTLKLPKALWQAIKDLGQRQKLPTRQILQDGFAAHAPAIVNDLRSLGVKGEVKHNKLVRAQLTKSVLEGMKRSREQTGLPGIQILVLSLNRHVAKNAPTGKTPAKRGRPRGKASVRPTAG